MVTKTSLSKKCLLNHYTCKVTIRSSTITSFVRKSAPIVALYWLVNFLLTNWFISEVLPTLESPRMITFKSTFFLVAMVDVYRKTGGVVRGHTTICRLCHKGTAFVSSAPYRPKIDKQPATHTHAHDVNSDVVIVNKSGRAGGKGQGYGYR